MITIGEIHGFLCEIAPPHLSEEWDNDGVMLCADLTRGVDSVLCALEVSDRVIDRAEQMRAGLVVTHHPFLFKPVKSITGRLYSQISRLMGRDIGVLSVHTRFDCAKGGVNDLLAQKLNLINLAPFGGERGDLGRIGELREPVHPREFAALVRQALGCESIRAAFPDPCVIRRVCVIGGAGKDYLTDAISAGCDAYLTADLSHNSFLDAASAGIAIFDAGHYHTENHAAQGLCALLRERFPTLRTETFDVRCPFVSL